MSDQELQALRRRVAKGKVWIESIKAKGSYWAPETRAHIRLWIELGDQLLVEESRRAKLLPEPKHSTGWIMFLEQQRKDDERRAKARDRARARAAEKRGGSTSGRQTTTQG